ncbi:MAG TPA: DUF2877 domain-containing protein [Pseudomonadales bacterium]|nr:DUF2877 domain-containing protein [Pseudomonadales bacterium]
MTRLAPSVHAPHAARALGAGLARHLATRELDGRVHSAFARAVNVEWNEPGGALLTLHGPAPLAAPFAMALAGWPEEHGLEPGVPVVAKEGRLCAGALVVDWVGATVVDLRVSPCVEDARAARDRLARALAPFDERAGAAGLSAAPGRVARAAAAGALRGRDPVALAQAARSLMGLGEGLTPAGDDWLVGMLAVLHRLAQGWVLEAGHLAAVLVGEAPARTTTVGAAFLAHALGREFAEPVRDLVTAESLSRARAAGARLAAMGATSGADTLSGMRAAVHALGVRRA